MTELIDLFSSAAAGGLLGIVGSLASGVFSWFKRRDEIKRELEVMDRQHGHELEMRDQDIKYMQAEAEAANQKLELELESKQMDTSLSGYQASIQQDISTIDHQGHPLLMAAEFIRKVYRPLLTTVLFVLVYLFYQDASAADKSEIVNGVLSLAAAAGTWWFSDRTQLKSGTIR